MTTRALGPIAVAACVPRRLYPWVVSDMLDSRLAGEYLRLDFVERSMRLRPPVSRWISAALSMTLGNIGALAGKPVMEGKGCLFKKFAGIDVFDIELAEKDPDKLVEIIAALEPTFGGINLEDIKAPECFEIEEELKRTMNIPVFHDDQHGTAIISGAALLNALEITGKRIADVRVVFSGAGAAALACLNLLVKLGLPRDKLVVTVDHHGNTSAASVPLALDEYVRAGKIRAGHRVLMQGVGGGFTWGATLATM